jgi:transcriptional regulator with XRE-family HTH domain
MLQKKGLRDNKRYTQRDMASGIGLSDNAISRLMRYETLDNVPLGHVLMIAKWLEVPVEELIYEEISE